MLKLLLRSPPTFRTQVLSRALSSGFFKQAFQKSRSDKQPSQTESNNRESHNFKLSIPLTSLQDVQNPGSFLKREDQSLESLFSEQDISQFMSRQKSESALWHLEKLKREKNKEKMLQFIDNANISPSQRFEALLEVSSMHDQNHEKLKLIERQKIAIICRAIQISKEQDLPVSIQNVEYMLKSALSSETQHNILDYLTQKCIIYFQGSASQSISTIALLLRADSQTSRLQVSTFEQFFSYLSNTKLKDINSEDFQSLINIVDYLSKTYPVGLVYTQDLINELLASRNLENIPTTNQTLLKLLDFFYRYNASIPEQIQEEFFNKRLIQEARLMERFTSEQLIELVRSFSTRLQYKRKAFEYMDYSQFAHQLRGTERVKSVESFFGALVQEFKQKLQNPGVIIEIFRQMPEFFKTYLKSSEHRELKSQLIQCFRPSNLPEYQGYFNMLRLLGSDLQEKPHIDAVVTKFLSSKWSANDYEELQASLASRVALLQASQQCSLIANCIAQNKNLLQNLVKRGGMIRNLAQLFGLSKKEAQKVVLRSDSSEEEKEELDLFLFENSSNLVRLIYHLQRYQYGVSEQLLQLIKPKALISDAIDKYCKISLRLRLNSKSIASLVSNLKTLEMKEASIYFNTEVERKRIKEDYQIVLKSILQMYKKYPELKESHFSSPAFGWLVQQVFDDLSERDKILSLDILGKSKIENYVVEFLETLSNHYTPQRLSAFLKQNKSDLLLALVEVWPSFIKNQAIINIAANLIEIPIPSEEHLPLLESLAAMNVVHEEFIENTLQEILGFRNNEERGRQLSGFLECVSNLGYGVQNIPRLLGGIINAFKEVKLMSQQDITNFFLILLYRTGQAAFLQLSKSQDRTRSILRNMINHASAPYSLSELLEFSEAMLEHLSESLILFKSLEVENFFTQEYEEVRYYECIETKEASFDKVLQISSMEQLKETIEESSSEEEESASSQAKHFYSPRAYQKEQNLEMRNYRDLRSQIIKRQLNSSHVFANVRRNTSIGSLMMAHKLKAYYLLCAILENVSHLPLILEGREYDRKIQAIEKIENPKESQFMNAIHKELVALRMSFFMRRTVRNREKVYSCSNITFDRQTNFTILFDNQPRKVYVFRKQNKRKTEQKGVPKLKRWLIQRDNSGEVIDIDLDELESKEDFESWDKEGAALAHLIHQKLSLNYDSFVGDAPERDEETWF